jgi:hypothetical protein
MDWTAIALAGNVITMPKGSGLLAALLATV